MTLRSVVSSRTVRSYARMFPLVPASVVPCCASLGLQQLLDEVVVLARCAARRPAPSGAATRSRTRRRRRRRPAR
eukprot:2704596-Prymnesium_polylepis.1